MKETRHLAIWFYLYKFKTKKHYAIITYNNSCLIDVISGTDDAEIGQESTSWENKNILRVVRWS